MTEPTAQPTDTQQKLQQALGSLNETYGADQLKAAAEVLLGRLQATRQLPAEYARMLSPAALDNTAYALDASVDDVIVKGQAREAAYANRGQLVQDKVRIENEIKTLEAEAIINGDSDGKTISWEGKPYPFNNDVARDAFRRTVTRDKRKELADVEGKLASLEVAALQARDGWETVVQASESARRKAHVQAELLNWLAGGRP